MEKLSLFWQKHTFSLMVLIYLLVNSGSLYHLDQHLFTNAEYDFLKLLRSSFWEMIFSLRAYKSFPLIPTIFQFTKLFGAYDYIVLIIFNISFYFCSLKILLNILKDQDHFKWLSLVLILIQSTPFISEITLSIAMQMTTFLSLLLVYKTLQSPNEKKTYAVQLITSLTSWISWLGVMTVSIYKYKKESKNKSILYIPLIVGAEILFSHDYLFEVLPLALLLLMGAVLLDPEQRMKILDWSKNKWKKLQTRYKSIDFYTLGFILSFLLIQLMNLHDGKYNLWYDELASLTVIENDWFWTYLQQSNHPPLYFVLIRAIWDYIGTHHFLLKYFSMLVGCLFIYSFASTLKKYLGHWTAYATTLILVFNPLYLYFFQEIRPYNLVILLSWMIVKHIAEALINVKQKKELIWFFVLGVLALYSSYVSGLIFVILGALYIVIIGIRDKRFDWQFLISYGTAGFAYLPWFLSSYKAVASRHLGEAPVAIEHNVFLDLLQVNSSFLNIDFKLAWPLLVFLLIFYLVKKWKENLSSYEYFFGFIILLNSVVLCFFVLKAYFFPANYLLVDRYLIWWGVSILSLIALVFRQLIQATPKWAVILIPALVGALSNPLYFVEPTSSKIVALDYGENIKNSLEYIQENNDPKQRYLYYPFVHNYFFLKYILRDTADSRFMTLELPEFNWYKFVNCDGTRWSEKDLRAYIHNYTTGVDGVWLLYHDNNLDCGPLGFGQMEYLKSAFNENNLYLSDSKSFGAYQVQRWVKK